MSVSSPAAAQQFVVDDVPITEPRTCQLEIWHSESASWVLPACHLLPGIELAAGVGFTGDDRHATEYVVQAKYAHIEPVPNGVGIGVVVGIGFGPLWQVAREGVAGFFGYIPLTAAVGGDRLHVHLNLGAQYERAEAAHGDAAHDREPHGHHAVTWGVRADVAAPLAADRFTLIGELFGEARGHPEYQIGLRSAVRPDRLRVDVSWGGHTAPRERGIGWSVGLAWTPPPIFGERPKRHHR